MKTFELADRKQIPLFQRNLGGSRLIAMWYPPNYRDVRFEVYIGQRGAVQLNAGRLHLGRYRRNHR